MTNERFNDDVVPDSQGAGGMSSGASAADSSDVPRGTGLTGDAMTGDADLNTDADFSAGADYTGDTDLTVDSTAGRDSNLSDRDANLGDLSDPDDPGHVFDQTNNMVDGLQGETDEEANDETSRADRGGDGLDGTGGPLPFPSSR
jgi:hypothetical protein